MHEGDHSILDHNHNQAPGREQEHPAAPPRGRGVRVVAAAIVAAAILLFLLFRVL